MRSNCFFLFNFHQVFDETSIGGTAARIDIAGRSNLINPILDLNGEVEGRGYSVNFVEGQDESVQIVSDRVFIQDNDLDSVIVNITVRITNPQLPQEYLTFVQDPPSRLNVTEYPSTEIVVTAIDPPVTALRDFITVLVSLRYVNKENEPVAVDRNIEFVIFDGARVNDEPANTTIKVMTINDVPVVNLNENNVVQYIEGSSPTRIASNVELEDPDSMFFTELLIDFTPFDSGNESIALNLSVLPAGSPITCHVPSCNGTNLNLSGSAPRSDYENLIQTLSYVNLKLPQALPNLRDRAVFIRVNDGEALSNARTNITIDFLTINGRVIIQLDVPNQDYATTYTENQLNGIPIVGTVRLVDTSIETFSSVNLTIRDNLPSSICAPNSVCEPLERIDLSQVPNRVAIETNTVLKRIVFSGEVPIEDYLEAISSVRYKNDEDELYPITRYIDVEVDPGGGAPKDTAVTNITIIHINDNAPMCNPGTQTVFVREDTAPNTLIHALVATDSDIGIGGTLLYTQTDGDSSLFATSTTGLVNITGEVDFEDVNSYNISVQVCDDGIIPDQFCCGFTLFIEITDFNDHPPIFGNATYTFFVAENQVTEITTFVITDGDSDDNAEVVALQIDTNTFSPESGCLGLFTTTVSPPALFVVGPGLDFETSTRCQFNIMATDGGGVDALTGSARIIINVLDQDDIAPLFTMNPFQFSVDEDNNFPLSLGNVTATDNDSPSFTFSLQNAPGFMVNAVTGEISILFQTDYNSATVHNFEVAATDANNNIGISGVVVSVSPANNDPPTLDLNITDVNSNNALTPVLFVEESGSPVTLLTEPDITDQDLVQLVIQEIRASIANSDNPSQETLSLPISFNTPIFTDASPPGGSMLVILPGNPTQLNGVYTLIRSIQYENMEDEISPCNPILYPCTMGTNSRTILIQVNDGVNNSPEQETFVTFETVNDPPALDLNTNTVGTGFSTLFQEGQGALNIASVGFISITDDDDSELEALRCVFTNPVDGSSEFLLVNGLVPNTLNVTVSPDRYTVDVSGIASIGDYITLLSTLQYNSTTSNPTELEREIQCYVSDGKASSNIATAEVMYTAVNQKPSLDLDLASQGVNYTTTFIEENGPVTLSAIVNLFDQDDAQMSSLTVTLNGASNAGETLSSIPPPPGFSLTQTLFTLQISGLGGILTYRDLISSITYNNLNDEISDLSDRYVTFVVEDDGGAESDAVFTIISIQAVDDNAPIFVPVAELNVDENTPNGARVDAILEVRDFDEPSGGDVPIFRIRSGGSNDFMIVNNPANPYQAFLEVVGAIDYDTRINKFYSLNIEATSGNFNTSITVVVNINNLPDLPPMFIEQPNRFSVFENEDVGENLMPPRVLAVDPDGLDNITYSIEGNTFGGVVFITIGFTTGELLVANNIDREIPLLGTEFDITITARDSNSLAQIASTVAILGVNEFPPVFSPSRYLENIVENAEPKANLVRVFATDDDEIPDQGGSGFMSNITFSIRPGAGSYLFEIDSISGWISQLAVIDFENISSIELIVEASDNNYPSPLTSTATVQVVVNDINDEAPFFTNLPASLNISEQRVQDDLIYTITFDDPDENHNLLVQFVSAVSNLFTLNIATGELTVTALSLDADVAPRKFNYIVELTDIRTNATFPERRSVTAELDITVIDENDNTPQFAMAAYEGRVQENLPPGVSVLQVSATDIDYGFTPSGEPNGNNVVEYELGSDAPEGIFSINAITGEITTNRTLNREEQALYTFNVYAKDSPISGLPNLHTTRVRITVLDENEHPPQADPSRYFISVQEETSTPSLLQTYAASQWSTAGTFYPQSYLCM